VRGVLPGEQRVEMGYRRRRRQGHLAAAEQSDDLPHVVHRLPAARLDRLQQRLRLRRRQSVGGLGRRGELVEPLLQQAVELLGEPGPVVRDHQRGPLVAQLPQFLVTDLELLVQNAAMAGGAADAEDDEQDRRGKHDRAGTGGRVGHDPVADARPAQSLVWGTRSGCSSQTTRPWCVRG
jgi:hypothetical protein